MEIKIGDHTYQVPDSCPTDGPSKNRLLRHLRTHGAESLLTSKRLAPFTGCVAEELSLATAESDQSIPDTTGGGNEDSTPEGLAPTKSISPSVS